MMNMSTNNKFHNNFVTNRSLYSYPSDDLLLTTVLAGGHFTGPGLLSLSHSYPPAGLGFNRQQPPLLPLPVNHMNMNIYRSNSTCNKNNNNNSNTNNNIRLSNPLNKKNVKTRGRDHSLTPKKSKNPKQNHKRDEKDVRITETSETIGPDPKDLPKDVIARVFTLSTNNNKSCETVSIDVGDDKFSGSVVFTPSPPPSSLPLPTFSLRPKLGCNAQAAAVSGVDAGATDSLRRLLRL